MKFIYWYIVYWGLISIHDFIVDYYMDKRYNKYESQNLSLIITIMQIIFFFATYLLFIQ